ncbi:MAG: hypothetical protein KC561_02025 [Myxococcales bacterium]|nr:hypothetical protein [Myxococcales bacterium]
MSDKRGNGSPPRVMSTDRPLDALIPELASSRQIHASDLHPRVLEVALENDERGWVLACWRNPGSPEDLHKGVKAMVEATLLAELSQPPEEFAERRTFKSIRFFAFDDLGAHAEEALRPFGFQRASGNIDLNRHEGPLQALRDEASRVGATIGDAPDSIWIASVEGAEGRLGRNLDAIAMHLVSKSSDEIWGEDPGAPSKRLADQVSARFGERVKPDMDSFRTVELLLVQNAVGPVRWIHPVLYQAWCDLAGVVAHAQFGLAVDWALCDADDTGFYPPPLLRIRTDDGDVHLPIGLEMLRWAIMPLQPDEQPAPFSDWLEDQLKHLAE